METDNSRAIEALRAVPETTLKIFEIAEAAKDGKGGLDWRYLNNHAAEVNAAISEARLYVESMGKAIHNLYQMSAGEA